MKIYFFSSDWWIQKSKYFKILKWWTLTFLWIVYIWGKSFGRRFVPSALKGTQHKKSKDPHRLTTIIKTGEKKDINQKNGKARKSRKCFRKICFNLESFVSMHLNDRPPCSNGSTYFKCKEILQNSNPRKLELHIRYFTTCHRSDSNTNTAYFEASKGSISNLMCLVLMLSVALNGVIQGCHQASPASNDFIYSVYYTPHCLRGRNRNENRCVAIYICVQQSM